MIRSVTYQLKGASEQVMTDCLALRRRNTCVENLTNLSFGVQMM